MPWAIGPLVPPAVPELRWLCCAPSRISNLLLPPGVCATLKLLCGLSGVTNARGSLPLKRQPSISIVAVLFPALACAQKPEYEFYFDFRSVFSPKIQEENHWSLTIEDVLDRYAVQLRGEMVPGREIARRIGLIRTDRPALDADYYNRFYLGRNSNFNHAPNKFLLEVMRDREPGAALDYGMGQGRNSIYLASIG